VRTLSTVAVATVRVFAALAVTGSAKTAPAPDDESIRPFQISFPEADLVDLRRGAAPRSPCGPRYTVRTADPSFFREFHRNSPKVLRERPALLTFRISRAHGTNVWQQFIQRALFVPH
jgi:hypothetical protein